MLFWIAVLWHFNPLPPHGGRQITLHVKNCSRLFQSTPSAWRETLLAVSIELISDISIHSLRMEGDYAAVALVGDLYISIHSLRMEGDQARPAGLCPTLHFNPLPPHGGRLYNITHNITSCHFNPLPPHGGRRTPDVKVTSCDDISIHSLRMEGDSFSRRISRSKRISIHSLRMEGDDCC